MQKQLNEIQKIKESLSEEDIVSIVTQGLGSNGNEYDSQGNLIFQTVCHNSDGGGKYKLYYYPETQNFYCYTEDGHIGDIFALVKLSKGFDNFSDAWYYVLNFFGYGTSSITKGFVQEDKEKALISDWDILNKYINYNQTKDKKIELKDIQSNILEYFGSIVAPQEWLKEDMTYEGLYKFGIRVDAISQKIIIPHYSVEGKLIGIRSRSYDPMDIIEGRKYMPFYINNTCYNHPLGETFYGLYENQNAIKKFKKMVIFEGEKSVIKAHTYYNGDNFCVATCGSNLTHTQINIIKNLGIREVILAYDKENPSDKNCEETKKYEAKLLKMVQPLTPYVDVYIVIDYEDYLDLKDSPIDKGQKVLEVLMKKKTFIPSIDINKGKKRKKAKGDLI